MIVNAGIINARIASIVATALFLTFKVGSAMAMVESVVESRLTVTATIVLPTCNVYVLTNGTNGNQLDFGVYDKSLGLAPAPINFSLVAFEVGSSIPGCSAFMAAPKTVISFGNPGQLDEQGVVTKGAGDEIRIIVRAKDDEASNKKNINSNQSRVEYQSAFAVKGRFNFEAEAAYMNKAEAGEYTGSLSFVVSYQ